MSGPRVVAIGGGHGLAVTLRACRPWARELTAIVSVADDGGSSGRLRATWPKLPAPGDIRRCLTSLAAPERATVAAALERRLVGGELDGHAAGNLLLLALTDQVGDFDAAVSELATLLGVTAKVLPAAVEAVELVGSGASGEVRGQVAVEATPDVRNVRLDPADPEVPKAALAAIADAELIVLGPGSFYGSVLAAVVAPAIVAAMHDAPGRCVLVHNLRSPGAPDDHVEGLRRHGIEPDVVVAHPGTMPASGPADVEVVTADVADSTGLAHDSERLGAVLAGLSHQPRPPDTVAGLGKTTGAQHP
jgi:uncharacterized cofD-like protein